MRMSGIVAYNNGQAGLQLTQVETHITIIDSKLTENKYGLHLKECNTNSRISVVSFTRNSESGVFSEQSDGLLNISDITATANQKYGLSFVKTDTCRPDRMPGVYARQLYINASDISENKEAGVNYENECGMSSTIDTSNFDSNFVAILANNGGTKCKTTVVNCTFINQTETAIRLKTAGEVNVSGNQFTNNTGYCISVESQENVLSIIRNKFNGNVIEPPLPLYVYDLETFSAVVIFQTKTDLTMTYNIFNNPDVQFQMATTIQDECYSLNATHNYWGSADVNAITDTLYGYHQQAALAKILYHPYLESENEIDFDKTSRRYPDVIRGHDIGGVITYNLTLDDVNTPYHVTKDIIVDTNGSLNIMPGVNLEFDPGAGVIVRGAIRLAGSPSQHITMRARHIDHHPNVRLLDHNTDGQTVTGAIQIFTGGAWHPVYYSYPFKEEKTTFDFLCRAAGFEASVRIIRAFIENVSHGPLQTIMCRTGRFGECEISDGFMNCSECDVVNVTCQRNYWSGIHLVVEAAPSVIQYVRLHQTNHYRKSVPHRASISVEFLQTHVVHDVTFEDIFEDDLSRALLVSRVGINNNLRTLTVDMRRGTAIECHDSRIRMNHVDITCSTRNPCSNGIYVDSKRGATLRVREELIVPFNTARNVTASLPLFLKLYNEQNALYRRNYVQINVEDGDRIAVELVRETDLRCINETVTFHDGLRNDSASVLPTTYNGGTLFYSTGSVAEISVEQYHHRCYSAVLHVYAFTGTTLLHISDNNLLVFSYLNIYLDYNNVCNITIYIYHVNVNNAYYIISH